MHVLNLCRQVEKFFSERRVTSISDNGLDILKDTLVTLKNGIKFISPINGRILDDDLKGIPDELNLPYPITIIEFLREPSEIELEYRINNNGDLMTKVIAIAKQKEKGVIEVTSVRYSDNLKEWVITPFIAILGTAKYDTNIYNETDISNVYINNNGYMLTSEYRWLADKVLSDNAAGISVEDMPKSQLHNAIIGVLELIEMLTCSNVEVVDVPVSKVRRSLSKKGKLPFDEYKILTIKQRNNNSNKKDPIGTHRSPREHLRRGHIRTYENGLKIFVSSCVINAGVGGKITKDYVIK